LPPHSAESLWLSVRLTFKYRGEAQPRRGQKSKALSVRQSLTAMCGGKAALA